jgi:tRNA 2-thiouridine synthesizing protein A
MAEPVILDAKGLKCPLPVLKARKAMREVPEGGVLRVLTTDPGAVKDFEHFCSVTGHALVAHHAEGEVLVFDIRKAG